MKEQHTNSRSRRTPPWRPSIHPPGDRADQPTNGPDDRPGRPSRGDCGPRGLARGAQMSDNDGDTQGRSPGGPRRFRGPRGGGHRRPGAGHRAHRGDARSAILALLAEAPMHGYQIMDELAERTKGAWRPSPGSIYPALRRLSHEGLVLSQEQDGRRVFQLTDAGRTAVADGGPPPWERLTASDGEPDLRATMFSLAAAVKQVGASGTSEQVAAAGEILAEARRRIYGLLAE